MAFYVYIVTNKPSGVLYTGMTDDLNRRMWEHKNHMFKGFSHKYNCTHLVWSETHETRETAFVRERQIKAWRRGWKVQLIEENNPNWRDLAETLI